MLNDPLELNKPWWDGISAEGKDFVHKLLHRDYRKRPTAKEVCVCVFFVCVSVCVGVFLCVRVRTYMHACVCMRVCMCACMRVCMCACMRACWCVCLCTST